MDTEQKNREAERQQQKTKRRPAEAGGQPAKPRRNTEQRNMTPEEVARRRAARQQAAEGQRQTQPEAAPQRKPRQEGQKSARPAEKSQKAAAPKKPAQRKAALLRNPLEGMGRSKGAPKTPGKERTLKKNSLQNFISGNMEAAAELESELTAKSQARQKKRAVQAEKRRKQAQRHDTPAVIYTQPAAFSRSRLLVQLLTVMAVVAALVMALSVFFKVKTITVSGAETYSAWSVREASGIDEGDNLLTFSKARASAQIRAKLSYVDKVRIGIKLPDTVNIYIEELAVAYAINAQDGTWWLINSDGRVVEQTTPAAAEKYTQVLGVMLENPVPGEQGVALEDVPTETNEAGELIPLAITGSQRLFSALEILKALEANDIVGQAASVNVSRLEDIILWYGTRYQVNLGDTSRMEYKIACMNDAILQMSDYQSGILDISFKIWTDQVGYTPFG